MRVAMAMLAFAMTPVAAERDYRFAASGTRRFVYSTRSPDSGATPGWSVEWEERTLKLG